MKGKKPMQGRIKKWGAAVTVLAAAAAVVVGSAGSSSAASTGLQAYGISSNGKLMASFTTDNPEVLGWVRTVQGLSTDTSLIGIDFRVQDGRLYGVGNYGGIYTISIPTPPATDVTVKKVSQLKIALDGTTFGVDFNPAADRLRVVSDTGQNLRHNLGDGTTVADTPLSTSIGGAAAAGVSAAAYTNNDLNADTATTLFDINTIAAQVVIQSPANTGLLAPTGSLGTNAGGNAGFDIYSDLSGGKTVSATGFATLTPSSGIATLYNVNLLTGSAGFVGEFPLAISDIAVALDTY
jgi:uncharacterized protein DUF4394